MNRILCIEDSREIQILVKEALKDFEVTCVETLADAREQIKTNKSKFDLILLDLTLPDGSGVKFLTEIRELNTQEPLPIFIITVESEVDSKVQAFEIGADDYICKPFSGKELKARVESKLRMLEKQQQFKNTKEIGDIVLNISKMRVFNKAAGKSLEEFTPIEFKLLHTLCSDPNQTFDRKKLIENVWGQGVNISDRTVDTHISHIRKKLLNTSVQVETSVGVGYSVVVK
jgi:two-component system phosphate regulon response regulator PhoB